MYFLLGPNTALAHSSVLLMIEDQVCQYTFRCSRLMVLSKSLLVGINRFLYRELFAYLLTALLAL
jgi:hypothetical protein